MGVGRYVRFIEKSKKDRNFVLSGKIFTSSSRVTVNSAGVG